MDKEIGKGLSNSQVNVNFKDVMQSELVGTENIEVLVDASKNAVCVVLRQSNKVIFCASKVLSAAQKLVHH